MSVSRIRMVFEINGLDRTIVVEPRATLLDALREACGLTGARAGCSDGGCGSCTVLVNGEPVRSCLMFAVQAHEASVRTVEGLADGPRYTALQEALLDHGAVACGYCTPGYLMLLEGVIARGDRLDASDIETLVGDNLCPCGRHRAIVEAVTAALEGGGAGS